MNKARAELLIRKPVDVVFDAFVNPRTLERFWLTRASGPLSMGATVEWEFMVPGAKETVTVTQFAANQALAFTWSDGIAVNISFQPEEMDTTRVAVTATGFKGDDAIGATEGFSIVLCDLKSLLETGRSGNMVRDKAELITRDMGRP